MEELIKKTISNINIIEDTLALQRTAVQEIDQHILRGSFSVETETSVPFYSWNFRKNKYGIESLLSGKAVTLMAHAELGSPGRVSVKFTEIKLALSWKGEGKDPGVMKELQYFQVKMSHHGLSYYQAGKEEIYVIEGNKIEFIYTNSSSSVSHLKVSQGDFILSPFGMWTFQIQNIPGKHRSFNKLKSFSGKVELMLVGTGTFLNENSIDFEKLTLRNHYKQVELNSLGIDPLRPKIKMDF